MSTDPIDLALARLAELHELGLYSSRHAVPLWRRVLEQAISRGDRSLAGVAGLAIALNPHSQPADLGEFNEGEHLGGSG